MKNSVELLIMELFNHIVCSYLVIIVPKSNYGQKDRYNDGNLRQLIFILNTWNILCLSKYRPEEDI